jgi:glucan 1,3-beta-glucosidase
MPANRGACIHWQVAQATSLQNIVFNMRPPSADNKQQGIFMDNGSGGWMSDLVFNGGNIAAFMGNQQFTARNFTFNNCKTAIYQNWGWVWNYKSLTINNCSVGIDLTQGGGTIQTVGSVIAQDAIFNDVDIGVMTTWSQNSTPIAGGTFVCDNCDFRTTNLSIAYPNRTAIVPGGSIVQSFLQGRVYSVFDGPTQGNAGQTCYQPTTTSARERILANAPPKPAGLLDSNGHIFGRSKPQYEHVPVASFVSVKDHGAKGDGVSDDTAAIQSILNSVTADQVVYFDHGAYIISDTIQVPPNVKMTGEIWPIIMVNGSAFNDMNNPKPVWRVGNPGDACNVEMSDLVFELRGPGVGAIIVQWNCAQASPGSAGKLSSPSSFS